jgi:heterotetrameric sarcosine oxidase gamma subunit
MAEMHFHMSVSPCAILQAESWPGTLAAFEAEMSRQLGGELPAAFGEAVPIGGWLAIRIAPRRFWLVADDTPDLHCSIDPGLGAVVSLSEGRMRLALSGSRTPDVLKACLAIDLDSPEAKPGRAWQTSFHRVPVLLLRTAADACDLLIPRSFARSLTDWVADAAAPYQELRPAVVAG